MMDKCLLSRIDNYFLLIGDSVLPMKNTMIEELLEHQFVPYEYDVDMDYLRKHAIEFGQLRLSQNKNKYGEWKGDKKNGQ